MRLARIGDHAPGREALGAGGDLGARPTADRQAERGYAILCDIASALKEPLTSKVTVKVQKK